MLFLLHLFRWPSRSDAAETSPHRDRGRQHGKHGPSPALEPPIVLVARAAWRAVLSPGGPRPAWLGGREQPRCAHPCPFSGPERRCRMHCHPGRPVARVEPLVGLTRPALCLYVRWSQARIRRRRRVHARPGAVLAHLVGWERFRAVWTCRGHGRAIPHVKSTFVWRRRARPISFNLAL